jgi:hypothetical protein
VLVYISVKLMHQVSNTQTIKGFDPYDILEI